MALEGEVRVGAPDGFGTYILARHLGALMDRHPGLTIQLVPLPRAFSLAKREADMAVTIEPPQEGRLSVRKLTDYRLSFYTARAYAAATLPSHPSPISPAIASSPMCATSCSYSRAGLFGRSRRARDAPLRMRRHDRPDRGRRAGAGVGMLHDYAARLHDDLVPVLPEVAVQRSYWLVAHDDVRDLAA